MPQQAKGTNGTVTILALLVLGIGLSWTYFRIPDSYLPVLENARVLISDNSLVAQSGLASMVQKLIGTKYMSAEEYIAFEGPIARAGVLANIGPDGKKVPGALPGVVVASPSTSDPDYFYTWTRDSALVFKMLVDQFIHNDETDLKHHLDNYVSSQKILQQVSNPSGDFGNGGLAEPKFHCNLTAFEEPWGRPQRDGPALRATTLIAYGNAIVDSEISYVKQSLWPVIKADLHYVAEYWNKTGFDLWEEVSSRSFFTTAVHHRALREGSTFASRIGETAHVQLYNEQADNILCFLQSYWNPNKAFMTSNTGGGRSGIDANSILASIHTFDPAAGCDPITFQPCSDKALSNLKVYVDSFRSIYPVNSGIPEDAAVATGRYSEDIYFEGNPWYLTTFAVAEQLYDALVIWKKQKYLEITPLSLDFFRQLLPNIQTGKYGDSTDVFNSVSSAVRNYADGFISVNAKFTPRGGNLAEQFNRTTGEPVSARDLTWSYAAAVTAFRARVGFVPDSWGAKGLKVVTGKDNQCVANSGPSSRINFKVKVDVSAGEHVFLTGSVDELKSWNPDEAVPLSRDGDTTWSIQISVPANTMIQYKYIRKSNGSLMWESDPNHHTKSPAEGGSTVVIDTWQG